jgi:glycine/D-amino acid oxidase-like deaminating enzyme
VKWLEEEYDACQRIGVEEVEWVERAPVPGSTPAARCASRSGPLHPTKYLRGLAEAIIARGGRIYADTAHVSDSETG